MSPVSEAVNFNYRCWKILKTLVEEEQEKIKKLKKTDVRMLRTQTSLDILSDSELEDMVLKRISSPSAEAEDVKIGFDDEIKRKSSSAV